MSNQDTNLPENLENNPTTELIRSVKDISHLLAEGQTGGTTWIIDRLVPKNGIVSIIGEPAAGKSFISLQIARCLAQGTPLFGKFDTIQTKVLLITKEDHERQTGKRSLLLGISSDLPIFYTTHQNWFFGDQVSDEALNQVIDAKQVDVLIIDSFRRILRGDENDSGEISKIHNKFKRLTDKGLTVIFIHHQGKASFLNSVYQGRGSSDITAMVDYQYDIHRDPKEKQLIKIVQSKSRFSEPLEPFSVRFPTFEGDDNQFMFVANQPLVLPTDVPIAVKAEKQIIDIIKNANEDIYQKEIEEKLEQCGETISHGTVTTVLTNLAANKLINRDKRGTKTFYSIIDEMNESKESSESTIGQNPLANVELSNQVHDAQVGGSLCN